MDLVKLIVSDLCCEIVWIVLYIVISYYLSVLHEYVHTVINFSGIGTNKIFKYNTHDCRILL